MINNTKQKQIFEKKIRNKVFFGSLFIDSQNRVMRVVDFRSGEYRRKHALFRDYCANVHPGTRKIFVLAERSEAKEWEKIGYMHEGIIPGYFKLSDAHIVSVFIDADNSPKNTGADQHKEDLHGIATLASETPLENFPQVKAVPVFDYEIFDRDDHGVPRSLSSGKEDDSDSYDDRWGQLADQLRPFSRLTESRFWQFKATRGKRKNVVFGELQESFANARIVSFASAKNKTEQAFLGACIQKSMECLALEDVRTFFSLVPVSDSRTNAAFQANNFKCTGRMKKHSILLAETQDLLIWSFSTRS